jgi:MoxR-like ATPase
MGVKINTQELLRILELTPAHQNIMLVGRHGIGKSQIVEEYFRQRKKPVVTLFLGQMSDPGDLIGLPQLDAANGKTEFRPPWWFPLDGKPVVLFLDELNRARPEILQTVMDLTLNKTLAGKTLPPGSQIISAVNEGEEYQLTDLDPALVSRFNIYWFSPTVAEWLLWAAERKIDQRIIDFIEQNPDYLDSLLDVDSGLEKSADRRSWQRVSEFIQPLSKIDTTAEKAIAGIVGIDAALKFVRFTAENSRLGAKDVLSDFEKHKKELSKWTPHELCALNQSIFRTIEIEEQEEAVKIYIENLEKYIKWLRDKKQNEVTAHWTTLYDSTAYARAKVAVLKYSPYIFRNIVNFINEIQL